MKEYNCFVDTNIFLRVLLRDEEATFKDCLGFLRQIKEGEVRAFTSNLILAEINWTLLRFYNFPKEKVAKALSSILKLKNLRIIDNFNSNLAMEIYKNFPLKFIDALIASNPQIFRKEIIIVSYDRDFDKIKVTRKEPEDLIE